MKRGSAGAGAAAAGLATAKKAQKRARSVRSQAGNAVYEAILLPHVVFSWVNVKPGQEQREMPAEEVVDQHGVPEEMLAKYLAGELKDEQAVRSLPWALLSVILYALMMLQHEGYVQRHAVTEAIDFDISSNANFAFTGNYGAKSYQDVNSFADFWSWMVKGYMPLIHMHEQWVSEDSGLNLGSVPWDESFRYLNHHRRVGPVRLAQELAKVRPCKNDEVASLLNMSCTETVNRNADVQPTVYQTQQAFFDEDKSLTVFLNGNLAESQQKVRELEERPWLTPRTNVVRVSLMTYHGDTDLLTQTDVNFIFARSGHIWKIITHNPVKLNLYASAATYVYDILFYLQVTYLFVHEVIEVAQAVRHSGLRKGMKEYMNVWNAIDWLFVVCAYILLVLWLVRVKKTVEVQDMVTALPSGASTCMPDSCGALFRPLYERFEEVSFYCYVVRLVGAVFPMIILCRLFKAFAAQPRLALVTVSLEKALPDLGHYLIVFLAIFGTYAVLGTALFGRELTEFATLDRSFPTLFRMLNHDFNYEEMEVVGRFFTFMIFMSFMWLVVLVMLSMLISIIMDWYCVVKAHATRSLPLWMEVFLILRRAIENLQHARLPLEKIIKHLSTTSEEVLTVNAFMSRVPELKEFQAVRLLREACEDFAAKNAPETDTNDVSNVVDQVMLSLRDLPVRLEALHPPPLEMESESGPYSTEELSKASFEELLEVAKVKLNDQGYRELWPGVAEVMRELLDSADGLSSRMLHQAHV